MDMTNFTFSEDEESFQSQTLQDNIRQISRQLILDSTPSPSTIMTGTRLGDPPTPVSTPRPLHPGTPTTPSFPWNTSFIFIPAAYSPHTPLSIFSYRSGAQTPVLTPPTGFRDRGSNNIDDTERLSFDLSTDDTLDLSGGALDLRLQPTERKGKSAPEQKQPLALVKPKRGDEGSTPYTSTNTNTDHSRSSTKKVLKTSSTCTSLDETVFYPRPDTIRINNDCVQDAPISNNVSSKCNLTSFNENIKEISKCKQQSSDKMLTGLATIKQSYSQSADDTSDRTSTTVIIDDAFQYLKDIPDETTQTVSDSTSENGHCIGDAESKSSSSRDLNQTYDVIPLPVLARKPPTGLNNRKNSGNIKQNVIADESEPKQDVKEQEPCNSQQTADVHPSEESSGELSLSDSSSFTSVTTMGSDTSRSIWSVKQAVTSITSNLTLTLTKTLPSSASSFTVDSPQNSRRKSNNTRENLSSTPNSRIVIGSNNSIEESTIVKEASQLVPSNQQSTVVSHPSTPNVSLCPSTHRAGNISCAQSVSEKVLSSTPRETRKQPIGDEVTPPAKSKEESLRTKLMKKSVSLKPLSIDTDSVLNIAFRQDSKKSTPVKRKKRSLLKALKKQLLCNNQSNASQLSQQHDQTVTGTCFGRVINPHLPRRKNSSSPNFFPKCNAEANTSSASISFVTLDRSSYSSPMPAWCKQILSTTEATSTPKPISTPMQESTCQNARQLSSKTSHSKSIGVSTSSLRSPDHDNLLTQHRQAPKLFDSVGISWLSQIDSYHTPPRSVTKSISTTTQESPQQLPPTPNHSRHGVRQSQTNSANSPDPEAVTSRAGKKSPSTRGLDTPLPKADSPLLSHVSRSHASSPPATSTVRSHSSTLISDTEQVQNHWVTLSSQESQINMISQVGRLTAEWLTTFIMDKTMRSFQSHFYVQPNRNVLLELCQMCNIKVRASPIDPSLLVLTKTSTSRAPTESDVKRLIRGARR